LQGKRAGSIRHIAVFAPRAEIRVDVVAKFRLITGEFDKAIGIVLQIGEWIKVILDQNRPAIDIAARALRTVESMLNSTRKKPYVSTKATPKNYRSMFLFLGAML